MAAAEDLMRMSTDSMSVRCRSFKRSPNCLIFMLFVVELLLREVSPFNTKWSSCFVLSKANMISFLSLCCYWLSIKELPSFTTFYIVPAMSVYSNRNYFLLAVLLFSMPLLNSSISQRMSSLMYFVRLLALSLLLYCGDSDPTRPTSAEGLSSFSR